MTSTQSNHGEQESKEFNSLINYPKFNFNDNEKQKKQLREVNELIKELIEKLKKD